MDLAPRLAGLALGTPLVAVTALLLLAPPRVDLVVVNGTGAAVTVAVGGRAPARVEAGAALTFAGLAAGRTRLLAREAAAAPGSRPGVVEELAGDLVAGLGAPRPTYVWDVAAASSFVVASRGYGDRKDERSVAPFAGARGRRLFVVPAGFVPGLDAAFPDTARVSSGTTGAVRRAVWTRRHADQVGKAEVVLLVDDAVGSNLRLFVDDVEQVVMRGGTAIAVGGVAPGRHSLRAVEVRQDGVDQGRVHTLEADLQAEPFAPPAVWVWNVAGAQREYRVEHRVYGEDRRPPATATLAAPGELFRLPADFYPGVNCVLPDRWGRAGVLRALWTPLAHELWRGPTEGSIAPARRALEGRSPAGPQGPAPR